MIYAYLGAIIFYLISVIGSGAYFFDVGKDVRDAYWQEKVIAEQKQFETEFSAAMQRVADQNRRDQQNLVEVINESEKRNVELTNQRDAYRSQRLRITTSAVTNCEGGKTGTNQDSSVDGSRPGRVELSREDSEAIWDIGFDAQQVVGQYLDARKLILDNKQCFEVVQ